jgi:hypothetical protein
MCHILYDASRTILPRRIDERALGTGDNARSRIRLHGLHPRPGKTHSDTVDLLTWGETLERQVLETSQGNSGPGGRNAPWNTIRP